MKRREFLKMANGATLTLVPGIGRWESADPEAFYGVTSPEIGKTKGTIQVYGELSDEDDQRREDMIEAIKESVAISNFRSLF